MGERGWDTLQRHQNETRRSVKCVKFWFCMQADKHVMKCCRPELRGQEAIVCSGHLMLRCEDGADG